LFTNIARAEGRNSGYEVGTHGGNLILEISKTKIALERPEHRWKDNIEMDLREIENGLNIRGVQWQAFVNATMKISSPQRRRFY